MSHIIGLVQKKTWAPRGAGATAPSTLSRQRFCSFGALHRDGFCLSFYYRANGDSFTGFLDRLRRKFGKVLVLADNAGSTSHAR